MFTPDRKVFSSQQLVLNVFPTIAGEPQLVPEHTISSPFSYTVGAQLAGS